MQILWYKLHPYFPRHHIAVLGIANAHTYSFMLLSSSSFQIRFAGGCSSYSNW